MRITYRFSWEISYRPKPIPMRQFDYDFVHKDYDGAPDSGDHRCGCGGSVEDCKKQIDEMIGESDE